MSGISGQSGFSSQRMATESAESVAEKNGTKKGGNPLRASRRRTGCPNYTNTGLARQHQNGNNFNNKSLYRVLTGLTYLSGRDIYRGKLLLYIVSGKQATQKR